MVSSLYRCVQDCSVVVASLPADSPGLFQNESSLLCESCDRECLGGCNGGTVSHMTVMWSFHRVIFILIQTQGPQNCNACRSLFIRTNTSEGQSRFCVSECPVGTYLSSGTRECVPCHDGCTPASGCVGPQPYLNLSNGCLDCDRVVLNRNGTQVMKWYTMSALY